MKRSETGLLAPHRALGMVCSGAPSHYQPFTDRRYKGELSCVVDNVVCTYILQPLRLKYVSNPLGEQMIDAMARDHYRIFAATGRRIVVMSRAGEVFARLPPLSATPKFLLPFGEALVVIDEGNAMTVFDLQSAEPTVEIHSPESFDVTALVHPATYVDQVLLGGEDGRMRLINILSGELVREYPIDRNFNGKITVLEQSPAVDVIAVGMANGRVHLRNLRVDQIICSFRQDGAITAISFRSDGSDSMVSGNSEGDVAVWDLNERMLVGQKTGMHRGPVVSLHFMLGQPYLVSSGQDNRLVRWVLRNENSLPEVQTAMEGHSEPFQVNCLSFFNECSILSAGEDGCLRQFDSIQQNVFKSYGLAREVKRQELSKDRFIDVRLSPVVQLEISQARESVWDNVVCRHQDSPLVSTWSTRRCTRGSHLLYHQRFKHNPKYISAVATSMFLSSCGNFALIGYSSGHLDVFNMQSGKWRNSFWFSPATKTEQTDGEGNGTTDELDEDDKLAHSAAVTGVAMDLLDHNVVSGSADGYVHFWSFNPPRIYSRIRVGVPVVKFRLDPLNSLLAVGLRNGELLVVDVLCRRVARRFKDAHRGANITVLEFSPDGRWLLSADDARVIKMWNLSTSSLIDVMKCSHVCLDASFSSGGEYLATAHAAQRAVYVWANKALFVSGYVIERLPDSVVKDEIRESDLPAMSASSAREVVEVQDEERHQPITSQTSSDGEMDEEQADSPDDEPMEELSGDEDKEGEVVEVKPIVEVLEPSSPRAQLEPSLLTLSGLPPARWANLPVLDLIRQRNKPVEPPKKPKAAPFFLPTTESLEGFTFDKVTDDGGGEDGGDAAGVESTRQLKTARRQLRHPRTDWVQSLVKAKRKPLRLTGCFEALKAMGPSAIDFQIRSMDSAEELLQFIRMLHTMLGTRRDFELVQSYMATFFNAHREELWRVDAEDVKQEVAVVEAHDEPMNGGDDAAVAVNDQLTQELQQLLGLQEQVWREMRDLLDSNASLTQWIKSALV